MLPLIGGIFIGLAAGLLLLFNGRILGVSGIVGGLFQKEGRGWRLGFLGGLLLGGHILYLVDYEFFGSFQVENPLMLCVAGLFVGFGSRLGNGCTSGHGICGISRLSPRSILATLTFIFFGMLTVYIRRHLL